MPSTKGISIKCCCSSLSEGQLPCLTIFTRGPTYFVPIQSLFLDHDNVHVHIIFLGMALLNGNNNVSSALIFTRSENFMFSGLS